MQNKAAIIIFTVLFVLVSLYQLSFTWAAYQVNQDAKEYAHGDLNKQTNYLDSVANNKDSQYSFFGFSYNDIKSRELNLGLDLKGGMEVILEVSVVDVIKSLSNYSKDATFVKAIALAKEYQKNSQDDFLTLFGKAFHDVDPNAKLASIFNTIELKDKINYNSTNEEVLTVLRAEVKSAIDNSFNILRNRIDRFGVTQPNIQRLQNQMGRVLIELPGIKEPERVRKLLQGTAKLEFWETWDNQEVYQYLLEANSRLKEYLDLKNNKKTVTDSTADTTVVDTATTEVTVENDSNSVEPSENDTANTLLSELNKKDSMSMGSDTSMKTKEDVAKNYPLFSVLSPNTTRDGKLLQGSAVGIARFTDTAKVNEYLKLPEVKSAFPRNLKFLWEVKPLKNAPDYYQLVAIKITTRDGRPPLGGDKVTNARAEFGNNKATAEVSMTMNAEGAKIWAKLTKQNIGRQIAIVLDNYVYSAPVVQAEIRGGRSSITGNFTVEEAQDLANVLKSGKLPAPARIIQESVVGPSLGKEAINSGLSSFILAFFAVLLYMIFYYSRSGWIANVALVANMFFIFGILASLGAVLTLPGIAGIVLTIGMSVDANVLIFERIREELRAGKGIKLAISDGYKQAYSSILDANITTLLTGIVLYVFGTGPIQGFATTLIIGILTSLFSAIFITRLIYDWMLNKKMKITFATKWTERILVNAKFPFIDKRKIFYTISGTLVLVSIIALFTAKLNLGIDFVGGRTFVIKFDKPVSTVKMAAELKSVFGDAPEVKIYGNDNQVRIATKYMIDSEDPNADDIVEKTLYDGLAKSELKGVSYDEFKDKNFQSSQKVGPTIADDIKQAAVWAVLFSLLIIFFYILIRFKNWQFGLGGIVALIHDTTIVLGLFAILKNIVPFSMEIDQAFIAAILTVVGYSINDTVVIFDRIREYITIHPKKDRKELFDGAMNSTLSRTINTSLTTFVVLLIVFLFGSEVIRGFVFAIMMGVVVGTYSSLFIASPITYDTILKKEKEKKK